MEWFYSRFRSHWVSAQFLIFTAYAFLPALYEWELPFRAYWIGWTLLAYGAAMALPAVAKLGRNLTPFPEPRKGSHLVQSGPYRLVRNPLYSALSAMAIGFALNTGSATRLGLGLVIFVFLDRKSSAEEKRLEARFPEYPAYRKRVRKMIPFLY